MPRHELEILAELSSLLNAPEPAPSLASVVATFKRCIAEIAELHGISRESAHDRIRRHLFSAAHN